DENIDPINWDIECDLAGLTGFTPQFERMKSISSKFRARGLPIAAGGIYATIDPEAVQTIADYLFVGEAEYSWPQFLREWTAGKAQSLYKQETYINMHKSPPPDLSYIRGKDYLYFTVQTSRGCPNNCDFCDVIRVLGRQYRSKTVTQIMKEVMNAQARAVTENVNRPCISREHFLEHGLPTPVSYSMTVMGPIMI
ncbi:MAG: hypothetical protein L7F78_24110, partial [Syntrophales bacterium LBB04]|nr:hypothetical protein [Syntrophales bacterium LBB04]